jgi:hypothetical protein
MAESTKRRLKSVYEHYADDEAEPAKDTGPKVKPVFVRGALRLRRRVPTRRDVFGRPRDHVEGEDEQAATEWDVDLWRMV